MSTLSLRTFAVTAAVAAAATVAVLPASSAHASVSRDASIQPFVRDWTGHDRFLKLRHNGVVHESVSDGCCTPSITLTLRVSDGQGNGHHGTMSARVTAVHVYNTDDYPEDSQPNVGDVGTIVVRNGVLHEPFSQTIYCTPAAEQRGVCGA